MFIEKNRTCFPQTFSHIVAKGLLLTLHLKRTVSNPWSTGKKHIQILLNNRATSYKLIEADEFTFSKFAKFVRRKTFLKCQSLIAFIQIVSSFLCSVFRQWMAHYLYLIWMIMVWLTSRARRTSSERACLSCGENRWTLRQQITCKSRGYGPGVFCQKRKSALMPRVLGMPLLQIPC